MANKQALRDLQTRLAERLAAARTQEQLTSWLAVESAGHGFLLPLAQAGEIFAMAPIVGVPYTQPWFLGVANLRGSLIGVVDLARFLALRNSTEPAREPPRLIVFNPATELNCALLVDRLAGLRAADQLTALASDDIERPSFAAARYRDGAGRVWQELDLAALASNDGFLKIVG